MDLESLENQRRFPLTLQLAPMIDIFVLIIVFLLKSTIVADVSIVFPREMPPPVSKSKEGLETFPEVVLTETDIIVGTIQETIPFIDLDKMSEEKMLALKGKVEAYIRSKDEKIRSQSININLITFRGNSYKNIFKATQFLRRIGFQSVAFIAQGEGT